MVTIFINNNIYVTICNTILTTHDNRFDFYQEHKHEYTIKFHCQNQPGFMSGLLLLAAFPKPSGELYEWSGSLNGALANLGMAVFGCGVLNNDLCRKFPFFQFSQF